VRKSINICVTKSSRVVRKHKYIPFRLLLCYIVTNVCLYCCFIFQRCGSSMLQSNNPATINYSSVNQHELYSMWRHAVRIRRVGTPRRYHEECSAITPERHLQPHHHHHHHHHRDLSSSLNRTPEALIGLSRCSKLWNRWMEYTWS